MSTKIFFGVDVGVAGGLAALTADGTLIEVVKMPATDEDILAYFERILRPRVCRCVQPCPCRHAMLERVSSSPQMGVTSAFTFGGSYRALRMALTAMRIPFDEVSPLVWQRKMQCLSGGDKNVTKQRAQQIFPHYKMTHAVADALLLAEYCRRVRVLGA